MGKLVGECYTPWPCFSIAVSDKFLNASGDSVAVLKEKLLPTLERLTQDFWSNKEGKSVEHVVANYGL